MAQGGPGECAQARCHLLYAIDSVFWPNDEDNSNARQELSSLKKLWRGDATWSTQKKVLGWLLDTIELTMSLPMERVEKVLAAMDTFLLGRSKPLHGGGIAC